MKLILATHNKNKVKEFKELLKDTTYTITSLLELEDYDEIIETKDTFSGNALDKAIHISKKYNAITIADDSGLEVYSINNEPGIYSARYSGGNSLDNNIKLLNRLNNNPNRDARFICSIAIAYPNLETYTFEGIWEGSIAHKMEGTNGFGYDPLFIPIGYNKTVAQLDNEVKQTYSHRALALNKLVEFLLNSN